MSTRRILLIAIVSITLILCFFAFFAVMANRYNPFRLAFIEHFEIINGTNQELVVVPIGMREGDGYYGSLPLYKNDNAPLEQLGFRRIAVQEGQSCEVFYDYDDINFRHILIEDEGGRLWMIDTDKMGSRHSCYGPQQLHYVIKEIHLTPVPSELEPCFAGDFVEYSNAVDYE